MTWTKKPKYETRDYAREMLRTSLVSLFWNILSFRKKQTGFTQNDLAARIGVNKSTPSRWFGDEPPNWEANTIADIADALDVDVEVFARDRKSGKRFAVYGPVQSATIMASTQPPDMQIPPPQVTGDANCYSTMTN